MAKIFFTWYMNEQLLFYMYRRWIKLYCRCSTSVSALTLTESIEKHKCKIHKRMPEQNKHHRCTNIWNLAFRCKFLLVYEAPFVLMANYRKLQGEKVNSCI